MRRGDPVDDVIPRDTPSRRRSDGDARVEDIDQRLRERELDELNRSGIRHSQSAGNLSVLMQTPRWSTLRSRRSSTRAIRATLSLMTGEFGALDAKKVP